MKHLNLNEKQIVPLRIKEARVSRGYSLSELSNLIGVTSQAISQYELGIAKPSPAVLIKISDVLNFPISFFRKPKELINNSFSESAAYFRCNKTSIPKKEKDSHVTKIEWIDETYHFLKKYVDFPEVNLPYFGDLLSDNNDFDTIEDIAGRLREHWGLGSKPISNLVNILQKNGFVICDINIENKKIDAFSKWRRNIPYIINGSERTAVRARFNLAHELGHLIMHPNIDQEQISKKEISNKLEDEAYNFAGAFLLPSESFSKEVISTSIDHLVTLKERWKVSIQAIAMRCEKLGLLSESQLRYVFKQLNAKGMRKNEPLDNIIPFEQPYLFKQALELLINNNVFQPEDIVDEISLFKDEIDSLFFLPKKLLTREETVIPLTLIRNGKKPSN